MMAQLSLSAPDSPHTALPHASWPLSYQLTERDEEVARHMRHVVVRLVTRSSERQGGMPRCGGDFEPEVAP